MNNTKQYRNQQEARQLQNNISFFMKDFKVRILLHGNGIRKLSGVSPLTLFTVIFSLPFEGVNFSQGIVRTPILDSRRMRPMISLRIPNITGESSCWRWRQWLGIVSTDITLPDEEIVRIYGKQWDNEVFFKMMKHYLNLERETQLRDYDEMIPEHWAACSLPAVTRWKTSALWRHCSGYLAWPWKKSGQ